MLTYGLISFIKLRKITSKVNEDDVEIVFQKKNYRALFIKGFLLNFINVGVLLFWFLILITIGPKLELETSRMLTFFTSVILTYLFVDMGKILLAKQLKHKMTPKNILNIKKLISILLILFGMTIMLQGWFPSDQKMVKKALEKME
jgi:threonine/homoserine/homoserine lactone efflux protein